MAIFAAEKARMVALEVKQRAVSFYIQLAPILSAVNSWTLNGVDAMLPDPFSIRVVLESYRALRFPRLRLDEETEAFLTAQLGDTLAYGKPPAGVDMLTYNTNLVFTDAITW
jgi:hypothetical protein